MEPRQARPQLARWAHWPQGAAPLGVRLRRYAHTLRKAHPQRRSTTVKKRWLLKCPREVLLDLFRVTGPELTCSPSARRSAAQSSPGPSSLHPPSALQPLDEVGIEGWNRVTLGRDLEEPAVIQTQGPQAPHLAQLAARGPLPRMELSWAQPQVEIAALPLTMYGQRNAHRVGRARRTSV